MTKDDIICMAREAGLIEGQHWNKHNLTTAFMYDFANRVYAVATEREREECAKACESLTMQQDRDVRDECAAAIRARKNT